MLSPPAMRQVKTITSLEFSKDQASEEITLERYSSKVKAKSAAERKDANRVISELVERLEKDEMMMKLIMNPDRADQQ